MIQKRTLKIAVLPISVLVFIIVFFSIKGSFFAPVYSEEEYRGWLEKGDLNFAKMHLYGWREAGKFYGKAYEMKKTEELREQLFLTLFLTAIREKDVKIVNPGTYKKIAALGDFSEGAKGKVLTNPGKVSMNREKLKYFSKIMEHYRKVPLVWQGRQNIRAKDKQYIDITLFDIKHSPLDLYLYLFCLKYFSFDFDEYDEQLVKLMKRYNIYKLLRKYSQSPLFIFFNIDMAAGKEAEIEKKFPQFAEFFQHRGNMEYDRRRLIKASHYYKKALEIIPDYTIALNGLGNIYYFTVQNYERAVECYAKTLHIDSKNPIALFGQAVSLHNLERYQISNMVLDFMLDQQKLYHGQAYYYKAYNHYHMGNLAVSRELVNKAETYLPESGEVNYLSGLLYYKNEEAEKAESDFLKVLQDDQYPKGNALFYLGMINLQARNWIFFDYFSDSIRALQDGAAARERELRGIDSLFIQDKLKEWMKWNRKIRLKAFKESSQAMIKQMTRVMEANRENHKNGGSMQLHMAAVKGNVDRVRQLIAQGANINARDREGYTALHRAVMMKKKKAARYLVGQGANVNIALPGGYTPLHEAAYGGDKETVEMLIAKGAEIYVEDRIGKTPLLLAAEQEHKELIELLKPLHIAVEKGDLALVKSMLDKEPHLLNAADEKWRTPLYLAVVKGDKELARMLIDGGAELDTRERDGSSLLGRVQQNGFKELAELLKARGIELSDKDMLDKELASGEAVIWYVSGSAWVIKTRNHVLVFNHLPVRQLWRRDFSLPFITSGEINPYKVYDKQVSVFITHRHEGSPDISPVFVWGNFLKDVTYFFGWKPVGWKPVDSGVLRMDPVMFGMNPAEKKQIKGLEIFTLKALERSATAVDGAAQGSKESKNLPKKTGSSINRITDGGVGFLVKADGLVICYAGHHANREKGMWQEYAREIDNAAKKEKNIDLLFLTASGAKNCPINRGACYAIEKIKPAVMFPMQAGGKEYYYKEFARQVKSKKMNTVIRYAEKQGQRFIYKKTSNHE